MLHSVLKYTCKQLSEYMKPVEIVYPKLSKQQMRVLTQEAQTKFVQYLLTDMDEYKFGILLALFTGIRIGEVCALKWEHGQTVFLFVLVDHLCGAHSFDEEPCHLGIHFIDDLSCFF